MPQEMKTNSNVPNDDMELIFDIQPSPSPMPDERRTEILREPGFGTTFTDHMAIVKYSEDKGWHDAKITAYGPVSMDPATSVLHYAQEIFEGMKAYRTPDGGVSLFRPEKNARRFQKSADRMAMPILPKNIFVESVKQLVRIDQKWIPDIDGGSLYLRPFMFASEVFLGVRPSKEYLYMVIASPAGGYFKSGSPAINIWVSEDYSRAAAGGTGAAKCGGNYAASLSAQAQAIENGCDQVVFLDATEKKWVEELGGMNLFFLFDDKKVITPPLSGTILPGITRESIITLLRDRGYEVTETPYAIDQWRSDAHNGTLKEVFACGTAAVVTSVGKVCSKEGEFSVGNGGPGVLTAELRDQLTQIQRCTGPDPYGWTMRLNG